MEMLLHLSKTQSGGQLLPAAWTSPGQALRPHRPAGSSRCVRPVEGGCCGAPGPPRQGQVRKFCAASASAPCVLAVRCRGEETWCSEGGRVHPRRRGGGAPHPQLLLQNRCEEKRHRPGGGCVLGTRSGTHCPGLPQARRLPVVPGPLWAEGSSEVTDMGQGGGHPHGGREFLPHEVLGTTAWRATSVIITRTHSPAHSRGLGFASAEASWRWRTAWRPLSPRLPRQPPPQRREEPAPPGPQPSHSRHREPLWDPEAGGCVLSFPPAAGASPCGS